MTIYPFEFRLGFLSITGYGLMMMVGFVMAAWVIRLELRRLHLNEDYSADVVLAAVLGGLAGAKLWYLFLTGDWAPLGQLLTFDWGNLNWGSLRGGFVWYGGFLGGVAGVLVNGWRKRVPARWTMELNAAPLAVGYALGRVGCFLVNDDYGIPSSLPWAMKFPDGLPPSTVANLMQMHVTFPPGTNPADVVAVHPTQIYETVAMLLVFWWLWRLRVHQHGTGWRFGVYLALAGTERFLVEFVRAKDDRLLGPLTLAQGVSILLVLTGLYIMWRLRAPEPVAVPVPESLKPPAVSHQPSAKAV
jgi:phosphatidylglycerol:prolipoprotein diacylglycerol transferase